MSFATATSLAVPGITFSLFMARSVRESTYYTEAVRDSSRAISLSRPDFTGANEGESRGVGKPLIVFNNVIIRRRVVISQCGVSDERSHDVQRRGGFLSRAVLIIADGIFWRMLDT